MIWTLHVVWTFQKLRLFYQFKFKISTKIYILCMQCAYSITIFLKDIQELFARIWEKSLQLSYLYMSLSSGVQCIVRFYVSTLLTRVVLFWHFNTQNLQDKQNFSHALRICCSFLAKALKPKTLLWWWFFGSPTI